MGIDFVVDQSVPWKIQNSSKLMHSKLWQYSFDCILQVSRYDSLAEENTNIINAA